MDMFCDVIAFSHHGRHRFSVWMFSVFCDVIAFSRPVYIGSCACVVKIVVKCSFEYLSVVHHTRRHPMTINIM